MPGTRSPVLVATATVIAALASVSAAGQADVAGRLPVITQAQSGKSFRLPKSGFATLRLSGTWAWTEPRISSRAIQLTPVAYFVDPGFQEWTIRARAHGTAVIRSTGKRGCRGCLPRSFRVTIVVGS